MIRFRYIRTIHNFRYFCGRGPRLRILCLPLQTPSCLGNFPRQSSSTASDQRKAEAGENPFRYNLYSGSEDPYLDAICKSTTMQHVLDIVTSIPEDALSVRHSAQALSKLWDIPKGIFRAGLIFEPSKDLEFRSLFHYCKEVRAHSGYGKIVESIADNYSELEDVPLASALLCLHNLGSGNRSAPSQKILEELLKRKESLSLPALSRVFAALRYESIYGALIMSELMPLLYSKVDSTSTDEEFRLSTQALHSSAWCSTKALHCKYLERLYCALEEDEVQYRLSTLCKIISFLHEIQDVQIQLPAPSKKKSLTARDLRNRMYTLLRPRVGKINGSELISLRNCLGVGPNRRDPFFSWVTQRVTEALKKDKGNVVLMSLIHAKYPAESTDLHTYLESFWSDINNFDQLAETIFQILSRSHFDPSVQYLYWTKVTELMLKHEKNHRDSDELPAGSLLCGDAGCDALCHAGWKSVTQRRLLVFAEKYILLRRYQCSTFLHAEFEQVVTRMVKRLLKDYDQGKAVLVTTDFAKCVGFQLLTGKERKDCSSWPNLKQIDNSLFFSASDLSKMIKSTECKINMGQLRALETLHLGPLDDIRLAKTNLKQKRTWEIGVKCLLSAVRCPQWNNARIPGDILDLMISWRDPFRSIPYLLEAMERIGKFIRDSQHEEDVSLSVKFLWASYIFGCEQLLGIRESAGIITRNFSNLLPLAQLRSAHALCFHGCLDNDIAERMFSTEFRNEFSRRNKSDGYDFYHLAEEDDLFMKLNRAVCLDKPEAKVTWLHQEHCEAAVAAWSRNKKDSRWHNEVAQLLGDIVGSGYFRSNTYSPYFYQLDFSLQLDQFGKPMKTEAKESEENRDGTKIAILWGGPVDTYNNLRKPKGSEIQRKRHLEIMGYRVTGIDRGIWNSKEMREESIKRQYLQTQIFH